jgi:hypothetical protein
VGQAGQRWVCGRVSHGVHAVSVGRQLLHREVRPHLARYSSRRSVESLNSKRCPKGDLNTQEGENFPESGKFHVIRIPDRVLVLKYFARFLSPCGTWNFMPAAPQYPISHSGWRSNELRGSIDCALSSPKTRSAAQVPGGGGSCVFRHACSFAEGSLHCFLPRCTKPAA